MMTPISSGMPKIRLRPIAVPITSAMSVAMMAISASAHSASETGARKGVAAGLRQVAAGGDGEPRAQRLQHDRHDVGDQRDDQQRVAELGAAGERGRPVAGVHVADRDEIAGAEEGDRAPPGADVRRARRSCDARRPATRRLAGAAIPAPGSSSARSLTCFRSCKSFAIKGSQMRLQGAVEVSSRG